ncbi:conserved hypothetical protein [Nitrosococcus halophilus Nc 4]|uniref:Uncharacterized protein n=1 Tax=Nitrosococcus halophilus (strain Nc4) TaxID=472759 RepID=D5C280_NITHN|nr:hypothetical protein [Nitrosococcus halophilus]ADE16668.1 conserved hypothetical protein [Nitrosococcus halophilus Nc 4]
MRSRYFLALAALITAQNSSGVMIFVDGKPLTDFSKIEIIADDTAPPPGNPPPPPPQSEDPIDPPPIGDGCPLPNGLTVMEEALPTVITPYTIRQNEAVALFFNRQSVGFDMRQLQFAESTKGASPLKLVVVSSCPGNFDVTPGCSKEALNGRILVDFTGNRSEDPRFCTLDPDQTYWLNIRHFDMRTAQDTCPDDTDCAFFVRP